MAATRLIAMHKNKGKTIEQCLKDRTDYAQNPEKTEETLTESEPEATGENDETEEELSKDDADNGT